MRGALAVVVLLTAACGDSGGLRSNPFGEGDPPSGAPDGAPSDASEEATDAPGGQGTSDAGVDQDSSLPASGGSTQASGGTGGNAPEGDGGTSTGGSANTGGASSSGGGGSEPRCDYIAACASVAGPCSETIVTTCGGVTYGGFHCGHDDEVTGYRFGDGTTFVCTSSGAVADCTAASASAAAYCSELMMAGTGGASGSGGVAGAGGSAACGCEVGKGATCSGQYWIRECVLDEASGCGEWLTRECQDAYVCVTDHHESPSYVTGKCVFVSG